MKYTHAIYARVMGDMPPYYEVPYAIWGEGCDFDSDGDADHRDSVDWRELDARLRPELKELISIHYPTEDEDLLLIQASSEKIFNKAIQYLLSQGSIELKDKA
ncbi:MAG: hypothetical protein KTR15_04965 [Phycisphaeraceae bacterium]|nr:hypothetical protein [Phycisphaeraceae bacterium]